jgi:DNA uptake protein ComE-like DNA-binding protein
LAIGIGFRSSVELKLTAYQIDNLKAYEIAKAGVVKALNELEHDDSPLVDTLWACGIALKPDETQDGKLQGVYLGGGHFDCFITDLQAKINLNSAPKEALKRLSEEITDEIADNIRAWRGDPDLPPDSLSRDYSGRPYSCKGAPFNISEELFLVKDSPALDKAFCNPLTVFGPPEFKVNINTADEKTIECLGLGASSQNIVQYRSGQDMDILTRQDNRAFTEIEELNWFLKDAEGGSWDDTALANLHLGDVVVFGSGYFQIRSTGMLDSSKSRARRTITCVVKRTAAASPPHKAEIIGWFEE